LANRRFRSVVPFFEIVEFFDYMGNWRGFLAFLAIENLVGGSCTQVDAQLMAAVEPK
jgi:hypothetical protein